MPTETRNTYAVDALRRAQEKVSLETTVERLNRLARKASEQARQELWAKGIPVVYLVGNQIIEEDADGTKRVVAEV